MKKSKHSGGDAFVSLRGVMTKPGVSGLLLTLLVLTASVGCRDKSRAHEPELFRQAPPARTAADPSRPNIIIISIDTLRADHTGVYGYDRPTTPFLDRFAKECAVFENCQAQSSWTPPSVGSLFTSLYPTQHGSLGKDRIPLAEENRTLAELLGEAGYFTAAFSASPFIHPDFGFGQGFMLFGFDPSENAAALNRMVLEWLKDRPPSPFFLYVMFFDPHFPYAPPAPFDRKFQTGPDGRPLWEERRVTRIKSLLELGASVGRETYEFLKSQYDAEIAFTDSQLELLIEELKARGLLENSILVITSDHGEEFLEHGGFGHGHTLYQELIRVPLIIRLPGPPREGTRIKTVVRQIDVLPTVLEEAGIALPEKIEGLSLLPLIHEPGAGQDRPAYSVTGHMFREETLLKSLRRGRYQLIVSEKPDRIELYDLEHDPEQLDNLALKKPELLSFMLDELVALEKEMHPSPVSGAGPATPDRARELLRRLGYL